jgi:hypothetical protein
MLNSRGLKLRRAVGIGSIGSVTLLKSIGALMLGLDLDCDVHGLDNFAKLELRDRVLFDTSQLNRCDKL